MGAGRELDVGAVPVGDLPDRLAVEHDAVGPRGVGKPGGARELEGCVHVVFQCVEFGRLGTLPAPTGPNCHHVRIPLAKPLRIDTDCRTSVERQWGCDSEHMFGHARSRRVYAWCMSRTNVDIDDQACAEVMRRYELTSKRDAVNLALRTLAGEMLDLDGARALRGSGWDGDLEQLRSART